MKRVKSVVILAAIAVMGVGCKEARESDAPEGKPDSPLKKVEEIVANVEGVKPPETLLDPAPVEGNGEEKAPKIPVAVPVPDKPGFVISPYNGKWIDVTGVKAGTLMADPHFIEEKKFFRVPELVIPEEINPEPAGEAGLEGETAEDDSVKDAVEPE